jgi:hypothetical protein
VTVSFPPFDRIANDRDEDLGIFRKDLWGFTAQDCYDLSSSVPLTAVMFPANWHDPLNGTDTSVIALKGSALGRG